MSGNGNEGQKLLVGGIIAAIAAVAIGSMLDGKRRGPRGPGRGGNDSRHYAVMFSVNDAEFRFAGENPKQPSYPLKTLPQAVASAREFVQTSAPIQGKAKVIDVRTGTEVPF